MTNKIQVKAGNACDAKDNSMIVGSAAGVKGQT
jgi:hypothetical protein